VGPTIIARNYAETLLALAERHGGGPLVDEFGRAIDEVAELLRHEPRVREFLETPRVSLDAKKEALRASFSDRVPDLFLRFLLVVLEKRRQGVLPQIAREYHALVDAALGRVRAEITLAREADTELQREIVGSLEHRVGKTVVPFFRVDPDLIGGLIVRVGDQVFDGSLRRRIGSLRRQLLSTPLPELSLP
jgi:F-type H+-transporting ATPase subunit delta